MFDHIGGVFIQFSHWIWRIAVLNLIWWLHVFLGVGVLGFFPATFGLFFVARKWLEGDLELPLWETFHRYYRSHFWKTNGLGWIYGAVGLFIVWDIYLASQIQGFVPLICMAMILFALFQYMFAFLNLFAYYTYAKDSFSQYLVQPVRLAFYCPRQNLTLGIGLTMIVYLVVKMPGLIAFAAAVMPAYWVMKVTMNSYRKLVTLQGEGEVPWSLK